MALLLIANLQGAQPAWTWSLYEADGLVVLANEIPDTPRLRATLECAPGTGLATLALYGPGATGMATLTAGGATAATQAERAQGDRLEMALRTDHPVFQALAAEGQLDVRIGEQTRTVDLNGQGLPMLRRFAGRCGG
ncbi:hypothetical protein ASG17_12445 [Brevundimonas sp. Leaf363]|nr:hypothetical protein ASG17_12445 [Brevundimonas sp. Leaf363]